MLNAYGPLNKHLACPVDPETGRSDYYNRQNALSLNERVYGNHLLLTFCGHDPELRLTEHQSLNEMQQEIVGPAGSLNCWIDAQFAFHNLKPAPFTISYTDEAGNRKVFDIEDRPMEPHSLKVEFEWQGSSEG